MRLYFSHSFFSAMVLFLSMVPCGNIECVGAEGIANLPAREAEGGEFRFIDKVAVLSVGGSPQEIGRQTGLLMGAKADRLLDYPRLLLSGKDGSVAWKKMVECGRELWENAPADHREELDEFVGASGIDRDTLLVGNLMMDMYRGMGCSSLLVESARSKTGGPLFGRNLDFFGGGVLHKFTLVTVCRPTGKRSFASVGFAGLTGCLSGMNDAGLAVAVHEVMVSRDGSKLFNLQGVPYAFAFRRILEECKTVDEAEKLLRGMERTTMLNLAVCDRKTSAVLEMTPKSVVRRNSKDGICVCTNHFCSPQLMIFPFCRRFGVLDQAREMKRLGVEDVAKKMHEASSGQITMQTMIFEPQSLRLHLASGKLPASSGPMRRVDLKELLQIEGVNSP